VRRLRAAVHVLERIGEVLLGGLSMEGRRGSAPEAADAAEGGGLTMPHSARWRCIFGHRWERIDTRVFELGRGYETATTSATCARCGFVGAWMEVSLLMTELRPRTRPDRLAKVDT